MGDEQSQTVYFRREFYLHITHIWTTNSGHNAILKNRKFQLQNSAIRTLSNFGINGHTEQIIYKLLGILILLDW